MKKIPVIEYLDGHFMMPTGSCNINKNTNICKKYSSEGITKLKSRAFQSLARMVKARILRKLIGPFSYDSNQRNRAFQ